MFCRDRGYSCFSIQDYRIFGGKPDTFCSDLFSEDTSVTYPFYDVFLCMDASHDTVFRMECRNAELFYHDAHDVLFCGSCRNGIQDSSYTFGAVCKNCNDIYLQWNSS